MEFATVSDIMAGWKPLTENEQARASVIASRASAIITARAARRGIVPEEMGAAQLEVCRASVCDAVRHSLSPSFSDGGYGEMAGEMEGGAIALPERMLADIGLGRTGARLAGAVRD